MPRLTKVEGKSSTSIVGPGKRMSMPELSALVQKYDKSVKPSGVAKVTHKDSKKKDSMLNLSSPAREVSMVELSAVARQKKGNEGLDGGVWYSLFIKNLAHYSSHKIFWLFIKMRPLIH